MNTRATAYRRSVSRGGRARKAAGFSLAELLLVCLLGGLVGGLVLGLLLVVQRGLLPQRLSHNGESLAQAPCFEPLPAALALHAEFRTQLSRGTAAYVFGGAVGGATEDWKGGRVLAATGLPELVNLERGLPADSGSFAEIYGQELGAFESGQGAEDFSVVVLGRGRGAPRAHCLVQCRSKRFEREHGEVWTRREVRLWAEGGLELTYVFAEPVAAGLFCGALHSWYTPQTLGARGEEGPATLVFPDPWVFSGARSETGGDPAGSRFTYFLPLHP